MPDKAAAGVYYVHQIQTRCGALTMQTTTAPVSASRRAAATPTAATHGHHFSTPVAVQHWLQHVNDRITQDAQLVLTAVHEDAGVDGDVDGEDNDDDDVVVATSKMTVQRARPALHTARLGCHKKVPWCQAFHKYTVGDAFVCALHFNAQNVFRTHAPHVPPHPRTVLPPRCHAFPQVRGHEPTRRAICVP